MTRLWRCAAAAAMGVACAVTLGCGSDVDGPPALSMTPTVLMATAVLADRPEVLEDTLGLAGVTDMAEAVDGFWVSDGRADRLLRFDTELRATASVGASGSGPGELAAPMYMASSDRGLAVMELNNGRISVFDPDGRFLRTVTLPVPAAPFDWTGDGRFLVATGGASFWAEVSSSGRARPLGERRAEPSPFTHNRVMAMKDGRVLLLDDAEASIRVFDREGREQAVALLPPEVAEESRTRERGDARRVRVARCPPGPGEHHQVRGNAIRWTRAGPHFGRTNVRGARRSRSHDRNPAHGTGGGGGSGHACSRQEPA